jgi:PTH1 family peptidyl-tRNA hydrolase
VVVDDFNLPLGSLRLRPAGTDGGHNGLASLIDALATEQFARIRLGIGPVTDNVDTVDFVLGTFEAHEEERVEELKKAAVEAVLFTLDHPLDQAMTRHNINPARL